MKQIHNDGFKTEGKSKFKVPGYLETQEFNKGKTIIAFSLKERRNNRIEYSFEIIQF
jgi:hypothetical protein